nr:reverse transcriptase domain-containing protein [Tanacetum cinerariifolium]
MVAYLTKSDASEGFTQVIDFLNRSYIKYALTVNPDIYVSYIKQFWNTIVIKQVNDVTRLQALVNKKKVSLSAKRTSWNEFNSAMASAVICLSTEALDACAALTRRVEHLEYDKVAQALEIKKLKRRVKKLEKGNRVKMLKLRRLKRVGTTQRVSTSEDTVMDDESNQGRKIDKLDEDDVVALMDDKEEDKKEEEAKEDEPVEVQEVVDVVTTAKLITEVVTTASETVTAAKEESTTSSVIPTDTKSKDKEKGIMVEEPKPFKKKQQVEMDEEYARKLYAELNKDIDWDVAIDHVKQKAKEDLAVQRYQVMKKKPQTEAQARKNIIMYLKNVVGFRLDYFKGILDYFKGMSYDDIRLIFEAKFNSNIEFLLKTKEQMEEEESRALQSINKTTVQKAAKRRKLNKKVEDLKRHLEIVPDEDDDVYTKPTPLPHWDYDPGKLCATSDIFVILDFFLLGMDVCHALADLGASINLMPLSIWKKISLPKLTPTRMTVDIVYRSITRPKGVTEYVFIKVEKFYFLTDFVVVYFEADPRVPLILGRSFLRTGHALIDVYGEEITLRINDEAVTFNLNQTTRYSST